jgi:hypothetical protein
MFVHHVSSRWRTIAKYMPVSLYIRAHQNAQETLGYMVIQIIYKQLLTHIYRH